MTPPTKRMIWWRWRKRGYVWESMLWMRYSKSHPVHIYTKWFYACVSQGFSSNVAEKSQQIQGWTDSVGQRSTTMWPHISTIFVNAIFRESITQGWTDQSLVVKGFKHDISGLLGELLLKCCVGHNLNMHLLIMTILHKCPIQWNWKLSWK